MLKVDPENSTKDIANAVRAERSIKGQPTQVETTPKGSKGSLGLAEVTSYSVAAQLRTMKICPDDHMKIEITPNHDIVPWMVRHCSWLLLKYQLKFDGKSAYEHVRGQAYKHDTVEFGDQVLHKLQNKAGDKLDAKWQPGA